MKLSQIALTLYTLRDFCSNEINFASTLKRVREIGYQAVQISGVNVESAERVRHLVAEEGLVICATHEPSQTIIETPGKVVERLQTLGCRYTAFPAPGPYPVDSKESCLKLARQLDASGAVLRDAGQVLTYHNHDIEFYRFDDQTILELIYENTDHQNLQGELDTFWVQKGGADPVAWCRKLKGRLPLLHLKDYMVTQQREVQYGEVGYGNLDWTSILQAAEASGCQWFIVEQDTSTRDLFRSVKMSFDTLSRMAS